MSDLPSVPPLPALLARLRDQHAPPSHLERLADLVALAEREPALQALCLVGSYAKGVGDRVSDLDLVAIAAPGRAADVLAAAHQLLSRHEVLDQFSGAHAAGGLFWKLVYLDFSSVEFHAFEPGTTFRLKRPYLPVWDPQALLPSYVVDGQPIRHQDFGAYEYGDAGLIWELVDCIKWLSRGQHELARGHLQKLTDEMRKASPSARSTL